MGGGLLRVNNVYLYKLMYFPQAHAAFDSVSVIADSMFCSFLYMPRVIATLPVIRQDQTASSHYSIDVFHLAWSHTEGVAVACRG